jgi:hypothetical protein
MKRQIFFAGFGEKDAAALQSELAALGGSRDSVFSPDTTSARAALAATPLDVAVANLRPDGINGAELLQEAALRHPQSLRLAPSVSRMHGWGQTQVEIRRSRGISAFSLVEALVALGLLGIFMIASLSAIITNQVCDRKAKEQAIAMNFLTKYVENIKALPFTSVAPGLPINEIYNGTDGAPLIAIPANSSPVALNTAAFQTFYPDLLWVSNLSPTMTVRLTQNNVSGTRHDIEINVKVDWNAELGRGGQLEVQVDFLRTVDVPTL